MPDREIAAWETDAAAPFLTIEGAWVGVWALGGDRFRVTAPEREQTVVGYDEACRTEFWRELRTIGSLEP